MDLSACNRLHQLAHELAGTYARFTIESLSDWVQEPGWLDTSNASDASRDLLKCIEYLESLGQLIHHPNHPAWVRLVNQPEEALLAT